MADYIDTAEAAKLIRKALKRAFPGVKFSVRISRYAGGSSIDVKWVNGPTGSQVKAITDGFQSKGFDGMIDLAYHNSSWLLPNGTAQPARCAGTTGSVPAYDNPKPHPDARLVDFASYYLFTGRTVTEEAKAGVRKAWVALSEEERSALVDRTDALRVVNQYNFPDGGWRYDDNLSDFQPYDAERIFEKIAYSLPLAA